MEVLKVVKRSELYDISIDLLANQYDQKNRGKEYWKKRYEKTQLEYIGYILKIDSKYVGFVGFIGTVKIIGLSVWYVNPKYRKFSLPFIFQVISYENKRSIVNSSPNSTALKVFLRMKGFEFKNEYLGLPKKIFGYSLNNNFGFYKGSKLNVCYNLDISLFDLLVVSIKTRKLCLLLVENPKVLLINKKINIIFKNTDYCFPLSVYGDIYE